MIVLADIGALPPELRARLDAWIDGAACWCALPAPGWRSRPTTIWCR